MIKPCIIQYLLVVSGLVACALLLRGHKGLLRALQGLLLLLPGCLGAQGFTERSNFIGPLPVAVRYADANNDDVLSPAEVRQVLNQYRNNPQKDLENEMVDEIEYMLIDLIGFVEGRDCHDVKKGRASKQFIESYYGMRFADPSPYKGTGAQKLDSLEEAVAPAVVSEKAGNTSITAEEAGKITQYLRNDSVFSDMRSQLEKNVKLSGLIDTYYSYDLNKPSNSSLIGPGGAGRVFDRYHNRLMLSMVQTRFDYTNGKLKSTVDLTYGLGGEIANYGNGGTSIIIKQVFLAYEACRNTTVTIGNFGTHIGYEAVEATNNFNYSVSNLFANGPFYHTGFKAEHDLNRKLALMCGLVSGWDKILDNNRAKSVIGRIGYKPRTGTALGLSWIGGNELPADLGGDTVKAFKQLYDLTGTFTLTKKFALGLNGAFGLSRLDGRQNTWGGLALYAQYRFSKKLALGARSEYFDDSQRVQYLGASYLGHTLTLFISPLENIALKAELRHDAANQAVYWKGKNNELSRRQTTLGLAVIGKF